MRGGIGNIADMITGRDDTQGWRGSGEEVLRSLGDDDPGWLKGFLAELLLDPLNLAGGAGLATKAIRSLRGVPIRVAPHLQDMSSVIAKLPQHTMDDLQAIVRGTGSVPLYHGAPAQNARAIVKKGVSLPQSGEAAARDVAKRYGITPTEWRYRVEPQGVGAGYGSETARLSTAPSPVAARWASHFPQGEVYSDLNAKARMYVEAKRRGVSLDDLHDLVDGNILTRPDRLGAANRMPTPRYGHIVSSQVDARAISPHTKKGAQRLLNAVDSGSMTPEEAIHHWNMTYQDIKVAPKHFRNPQLVREYPRANAGPLAAMLMGHNTTKAFQ
jgi:hypothetical protein